MWKIRSGWTAVGESDKIKFYSDTKSFQVRLQPSLVAEFFSTGDFLICDSDSESVCRELVYRLEELGVITRVDPMCQHWSWSLQCQYYAHVGLEPPEVVNSLKNSSVLILGLGGTGSLILQHLVAAGIGKFIILDDDVVDASNLERQFIYDRYSVGKLKIDEAQKYLLSRDASTQVTALAKRILDGADLSNVLDNIGKIDACAVCIDQPPDQAFKVTSRTLWERHIPFLHGGVMISSGFWGPFFCESNGSVNPDKFSIWGNTSANEIKPTPLKICFAPYNSIIAAQMSADLIHFLIGAHDLVDFRHRTFFNFKQVSANKIGANEDLSNA